MSYKSIFYIICLLIGLFSCREELYSIEYNHLENPPNNENNIFSSKRITLKQLKQEIIDWNDVQESIDLLHEKGLLPFSINDNITYRKIKNQNNITYTLPIHFYTNKKPYHLIQQIIINDKKQQTIQYLKIYPKNTTKNIQQDIFKTPNDIEILDHKLNNINYTTTKREGLKKQELSRNCRVSIRVSEILCSNGGRHGVGENCQPGYVNDAHYKIDFTEHCSTEVFTGLEPGGTQNSSISGGVYADYLINRLLSNPNSVYTHFITHPKQKLLLNTIRSWSVNNNLDNPDNIKILNSKVKYFAENPSIFDDIEIYDKRTPYVRNKELESYSTRIAEMFDHFFDNTSTENAKAMKYSIKYLDQNRFISWQDYLPIFKGIGKLSSLYPDNYWSDIEKALNLENITHPYKLEDIMEDWITPNTVKPTIAFTNHEKLYRIYNQAKGTDNFKRFLQKFEPKASVAHLMFDLGETKNDLAQTSSPNNYWIKIIFNKNIDWNNRPEIIIAYTFIHEILHAEMYRQLLAVANTNGSISYEKLKKYAKNNKKELFNEYIKRTPNYQHQIMAKRYIDIVIDFMKELYGNEYTEKEYLTIAWMGVYETDVWNKLSNTQKEEYETIWKENYNKWKK